MVLDDIVGVAVETDIVVAERDEDDDLVADDDCEASNTSIARHVSSTAVKVD